MKGRTRARAGIVEGHARGRIGIKAYASGLVSFIAEGPARVRVRLPMPTAIIRAPDGREIARLTKPRDFLALGKAVRPHAHMLAGILMLSAAKQRKAGEFDLLNIIACLLLALPRPNKPGRSRKASTKRALELAVTHSLREAARLAATDTGEDPENIRARVLGIKRRARKGGNKFK